MILWYISKGAADALLEKHQAIPFSAAATSIAVGAPFGGSAAECHPPASGLVQAVTPDFFHCKAPCSRPQEPPEHSSNTDSNSNTIHKNNSSNIDSNNGKPGRWPVALGASPVACNAVTSCRAPFCLALRLHSRGSGGLET